MVGAGGEEKKKHLSLHEMIAGRGGSAFRQTRSRSSSLERGEVPILQKEKQQETILGRGQK